MNQSMNQRDMFFKWLYYAGSVLLLVLVQSLVLNRISVWAVHPFLPPVIAGIMAMLEGPAEGAVFGGVFGLLCDLTMPGVIPCFYTLAFLAAALPAAMIAKRLLSQGFLCAVLCAALALVITDLLPHLGAEQGKKPLNEAIPGENLNLLMGSRPLGEEGDSDRVKLRVLDMLHEKYGICEDDFTSAELEVVPAFNATDLGLDRSLIGAYGHDDRVCGYAALKGLFDIDVPEKTAVCMLADKEEVGSMGVTGMQSAFFDTFMEDLCQSQGVSLRVCYESSFCLSSDVTAAYDPNFAEVYEKRNESRVNYGLGICKYTGARGKSGSSDADAETVAYVRRVLDSAGVVWQIGEMGKIDAGGGGTVAQYMANRNITTIDAGVPVLSMHSPFETVGNLDCYMNYLGCMAVYNA